MPGIPREVAEHSLDNKLTSRLVKQRLCRFDEKRRRAIGEEIEKLLSAGFIKEVYHPEWLGTFLCERRVGSGECALTTRVLTRRAQRICFLCPA